MRAGSLAVGVNDSSGLDMSSFKLHLAHIRTTHVKETIMKSNFLFTDDMASLKCATSKQGAIAICKLHVCTCMQAHT